MDPKDVFLDDRAIDEYVYNGLVAHGYAPGIEEAQVITDLFLELIIGMGIVLAEDGTEGE